MAAPTRPPPMTMASCVEACEETAGMRSIVPESPITHHGGRMAVYRPTLTGTRHMISAGHHAAAHAGFTILEAGGNAIDAGVAAGITVGVLQTDRVNFAGVAPMLIYLAERREVINIDGLGTWPRAVTPDCFMKNHGAKMPPGILRTVVRAAPEAWITALEKYGTMSFGDVAAAAIRFAREGFVMHAFMADYIQD